MTEILKKKILQKKTQLLCQGIYLDKNLKSTYKAHGIDLKYGRKGGAGPLGGRYFLFEDGKTLANVAMWDTRQKTSLKLKHQKDDKFEVYDLADKESFCTLKLVPEPEYYDPSYKTSDGVEMKKIALVHGVDCLASTVFQKCKYWKCGEACKFCGVELSLKYGSTILDKTPEQLSEVVIQAKKEGRCAHMTLTSGTTAEKNKGVNRYIRILEQLKNDHPEIPLHIQIEPIEDMNLYSKLHDAGADTIGIHIEILNDVVREVITPGKAKIPYKQFKKSWEYAVDVFGRSQVESFILTGFGESPKDFRERLEELVSIGVVPFITPVRPIPNSKKELPQTSHNMLLEIYNLAAKLMKKYGVNPLIHKAGCVRCGGCSAISEAYEAVNP
ncbi:MAG: radical SAM protein [Promethearchaeia archaeon]